MRFMTFFYLAASAAVFAAPSSQPQVSRPRQPLRFEANQGQADSRVRFLARGLGYTLFLTSEGTTLDLHQTKDRAAALRMTLPGSDPTAPVGGEEPSPVHTSYFLGKDPAKWHSDVPSYQKVRYRSVYPGIDLVFYGNDGQLEYDFVVAPTADPARIALAFEGAEKLEVDAEGTLRVDVPGGEPLRFHKPVVYQQDGAARQPVAGAFALEGRTAKFALGEYDHALPLVIDPVLKYSSYFTGGQDYPTAATADASGNGYVTGFAVPPTQLPTTPGAYQTTLLGANAYVAKFSPAGGLLFSTFLGGNGPDGDNSGNIQVDSAGNVWVAGTAESTDFPVTTGAWQPVCQVANGSCLTDFLAKLNPTGTSLLYSTYMSPYYGDGFMSGGIALDNAGNVYATGVTSNPLFPTTPNAYLTACPPNSASITGCGSNFFLELNPSLSGAAALVYSSFFGGGYDDAISVSGIAVDSAGYVYLAGEPGANISVTKFDLTAGTNGLVYNTYLGGGNNAAASCLTFDAAGNLYVTGFVEYGGGGVVTAGAYQTVFSGNGAENAFVAKLDPATGNVLYGTLLGGSSPDAFGSGASSVGADAAGNVYVVGWTNSAPVFPALPNPIQSGIPTSGAGILFVASLDPTLSTLRWATFLGDPVSGSVPPGGVGAFPSAPSPVDRSGNVFVVGNVYTGANLPTVAAYQPTPGPNAAIEGDGGFVARIGAADAPGIALGPGALNFPNTIVGATSAAQTVYILAAGSQPLDITSITASANYKLASNNCAPLPATLAGGTSCQVAVDFKPTSGGTLTGYLTVVTNARTARAALSGVGVPVPRITVSPKKLTFPATPVGTPSAPLAVTIASTGSAPLVNNGITIGGANYTDFGETDNCPASLNPGQSCTVNVVMTPLVDGPLSADLAINTNAVSGAVNPTLSGSGPDYTMSANPPSATVSAGASANSTITLTPTAGLSGKATLVCTVPSGSGITCAFVPKKVTLAGAPATSTATISTPATLASGSYNVTILGVFTGLPYRKTTVQITVQ